MKNNESLRNQCEKRESTLRINLSSLSALVAGKENYRTKDLYYISKMKWVRGGCPNDRRINFMYVTRHLFFV